MKKILSIFLVLCLISSVFAYENGQKIWSVDSDVYEGIKSLYITDVRESFLSTFSKVSLIQLIIISNPPLFDEIIFLF